MSLLTLKELQAMPLAKDSLIEDFKIFSITTLTKITEQATQIAGQAAQIESLQQEIKVLNKDIEKLEYDYSRDAESYECDISILNSKLSQLTRLQEKDARKNVEKIKKILESDTMDNIPEFIRKLCEMTIGRSPMITDKDWFGCIISYLYFIRDMEELITLKVFFIQIELDIPSKLVEILSNPICYIASNLNSPERIVLSRLVANSEDDSEFVANICKYINSITRNDEGANEHNAADEHNTADEHSAADEGVDEHNTAYEGADSHKHFITNLLECCSQLNIETSKFEEHICRINPTAWREYVGWLQKDGQIAMQQSREKLRYARRNMKAWIKDKELADKELAEQIRIEAENERIGDY